MLKRGKAVTTLDALPGEPLEDALLRCFEGVPMLLAAPGTVGERQNLAMAGRLGRIAATCTDEPRPISVD